MSSDPGPPVTLDRAGHVATVTINREDRRNALSNAVIAGLRDAVATCRRADDVRVVVLRGAGDRAFCAGGDLSEMADRADYFGAHGGRGQLAELFDDLWRLGKPTIARVAGHAVAGGFGLALACDFVIAADTAKFRVPEVDSGLWGFMITVPMLRSMPPKLALDLMLTARPLGPDEALRRGVLHSVVPLAELDGHVLRLATDLAAKPPHAVREGRTAFYDVLDADARTALAALRPLLTVLVNGPEAAEGLAAFAERRQPAWRNDGRRKKPAGGSDKG
jgi:enoyl-CoA hydratase/carnithine racemase